jgi:hypothetical protein
MPRLTSTAPVLAAALLTAAALEAQAIKPETLSAYGSYVQSAEARMAARKTFLIGETKSPKVATTPGNGQNPHKIAGAMVYDWVGTIFIPGASVARTVRMLQDYDHRAAYFADVIASSKLNCRTGDNRFGFTMRIKEPVVADSDNEVTWERIDAAHWRCRSVSGDVGEIGSKKGYLQRLNSYWRFVETPEGVMVEGQTITLSGEFGSFMRALGSLAGISPEKSLRRTLESMKESVLSNREFSAPPSGLPACTEQP